jgi:hypothetical protein
VLAQSAAPGLLFLALEVQAQRAFLEPVELGFGQRRA